MLKSWLVINIVIFSPDVSLLSHVNREGREKLSLNNICNGLKKGKQMMLSFETMEIFGWILPLIMWILKFTHISAI